MGLLMFLLRDDEPPAVTAFSEERHVLSKQTTKPLPFPMRAVQKGTCGSLLPECLGSGSHLWSWALWPVMDAKEFPDGTETRLECQSWLLGTGLILSSLSHPSCQRLHHPPAVL